MTDREILERKLLKALEEEAKEMGAEDWNDLRNRIKAQAAAPPGHECPSYDATKSRLKPTLKKAKGCVEP